MKYYVVMETFCNGEWFSTYMRSGVPFDTRVEAEEYIEQLRSVSTNTPYTTRFFKITTK